MKLNEKILHYRKAAKLSQEELAELVGVSRQAVSKWELGESTPDVDKLLSLARAFGVTTDELLSEAAPAAADRLSQPTTAPSQGEQVRTETGPAPSVDVNKLTGKLGQLIRRYGWLAGVYIALSGLGATAIGALARWGFGAFFAASNSMMSDFGGMGVGWSYSGPPELEAEIMGQLGVAPASPFGGIETFFYGFATVILVIGILTMLAGGVLALVLYQKGRKK